MTRQSDHRDPIRGRGSPAPAEHHGQPVRGRRLLHPRRLDASARLSYGQQKNAAIFNRDGCCATPSGGACRALAAYKFTPRFEGTRARRLRQQRQERRRPARLHASDDPVNGIGRGTARSDGSLRRHAESPGANSDALAFGLYTCSTRTPLQGRVPSRQRRPARVRQCQGWHVQEEQQRLRRVGPGQLLTSARGGMATAKHRLAPRAGPGRGRWMAVPSSMARVATPRRARPSSRPRRSTAARSDRWRAVARPTSTPQSRARARHSTTAAGAANRLRRARSSCSALPTRSSPPRTSWRLLETLDMGKPIQYSLSVDVPTTARTIAWYGEAIDKVYDEIAPTAGLVAGPDHARTDGRRRRHGALELPDDHGRLEAGPGAWPPATPWC